jgi:hypothetical protein
MEDILPYYIGKPSDVTRARIVSLANFYDLEVPDDYVKLVYSGISDEDVFKSAMMWNDFWQSRAGRLRLMESMVTGSISEPQRTEAELEESRAWELQDTFWALRQPAIDEWIHIRPGDVKGMRGLQSKYRAEYSLINRLPEYQSNLNRYATDDEKKQYLEGLIYAALSAQRPQLEDFSTTDEDGTEAVDYDAYGAATEEYWSKVETLDFPDVQSLLALRMGLMAAAPEREIIITAKDIGGQKGLVDWWHRNDTIMEAANRVWEDNHLRPALEAYNEIRDLQGREKSRQVDNIFSAYSEVSPNQIVKWILQDYNKWTRAELEEAIGDTVWPGLEGYWNYKYRTAEERELAAEKDAAWDFYNAAYDRQNFPANLPALVNDYFAEDENARRQYLEDHSSVQD